MPRVYVRKFDWDEARRLRAEGWSYSRLADHFGRAECATTRRASAVRQLAESTAGADIPPAVPARLPSVRRVVWVPQSGQSFSVRRHTGVRPRLLQTELRRAHRHRNIEASRAYDREYKRRKAAERREAAA